MREQCACGAHIRTLSPRRILEWRSVHPCTIRTPKPKPTPTEPDKAGATSTVERRNTVGTFDGKKYLPTINARIGFRPNDERAEH